MATHNDVTILFNYSDYSVMNGLKNGGEMTLTSSPAYGGSINCAGSGSQNTGFPWTGIDGATLDVGGFTWAYHWSATVSGVKRYYIMQFHAKGAWYSIYPEGVTVSKANASVTTLSASSGSDYSAGFRGSFINVLNANNLTFADVDNLRVVLYFDIPSGCTFKMSNMRFIVTYTLPDYITSFNVQPNPANAGQGLIISAEISDL